MISNLIDDISDFQKSLDNDENFLIFKSKYKSLRDESKNNKILVEINN